MSELEIRIYGDPVLRRTADPIDGIDPELRRLAAEMGEAMYAHRGIGLAAPQVGVSRRLFVIDVDWVERDEDGSKSEAEGPRNLRAFINPSVVWESDEDGPFTEGCLSIPGVEGEVFRPLRIRTRYTDLGGQTREEEMDGLLARCFQHELDHLDGVLFPDRMPFLKRARIAGALNRLKKQTAAGAESNAPSSAM